MNAANASKTTKLLAALVVLQGLTLAGIWSNQDVLPQAHAQGVDPGAQRLQQLDELARPGIRGGRPQARRGGGLDGREGET